jgi:predicted transcriptional regulator
MFLPYPKTPTKGIVSNTDRQPLLRRLTAQIVVAHASHSQLTSKELRQLIETAYSALSSGGEKMAKDAEPQRKPMVPVTRSVFRDHIVCLENGKRLKTLKRHLMASYNLTPVQYRQKWGLPADYPMIAPEYAERRSLLAVEQGFGQKPPPPKRGSRRT